MSQVTTLSQQMQASFDVNIELQNIQKKWQNIYQLINNIKTDIQLSNVECLSCIQPSFTIFEQIESKLEKLKQEIFAHQKAEVKLLEMNAKLHRFANTDGLTEVANRYCFDRYLEQEWRRSIRDERTLSLILCDVDFFKQYNDLYGHQAGDECLRKVAQAISRAVKRPADLVARYGGEEFVVILPETDRDGAIRVGEEIRSELQKLQIPHERSSVNEYVTLSLGLASMIPTQAASPEQLVAEADARLYEAKNSGRNCLKCRDAQPRNPQKISITLREIEPNQCTSIIHWCFDAKKFMISIGRVPDNDIVLYNPAVSRYHMKLRRVGDRWQLICFGQNKTYIDEQQVNQVVLEGGEVIHLPRSVPAIQIDLK